MKCCPKDETFKREWLGKLERKSKNIPEEKVIEICNFSKVLSHPLRVKIALLLSEGDHCVCELVSILKENQNLVSHHLSIMKNYRVISSHNQSKYKYYTIEKEASDYLGILLEKR